MVRSFKNFFVKQQKRNFADPVVSNIRQDCLLGGDHQSLVKRSDEQSREIRISVNEVVSGQISFSVDFSNQNTSANLEFPSWTNPLTVFIKFNLKIYKLYLGSFQPKTFRIRMQIIYGISYFMKHI